MASLPKATTTVSTTAGALAAGLDIVCVWTPCALNADATPRLFGGAKAIHSQHGYCGGVEYGALHAQRAGKPMLVCGLEIETPGVIGREDTSGNTGSCVTTLAAGVNGVLFEHNGDVTVERGGTIGTDPIVLGVSLDGGRVRKSMRLGTATSLVLPHVGVTMSFAAGDLVAGETIHTWHGTAPRAGQASMQAAREALAAQSKAFRSVLLIGDLQDSDDADDFATEIEAYETENERFVYGRASIKDREPQAALSNVSARMTGSPTLTFAEVDTEGDTITRSAGSWIADGFAVGDTIEITGATASAGANNISAVIASLSATVITLGAEDLEPEVSANCSVVGHPTLTFANSGETITRNRGSWLADGFRVGDSVTIAGTDSATNDGTFAATVVTALVLTLASGAVDADEVISTADVSITAGQTKAAWMAAAEAEFEPIDDRFRVDLSAGRGRVLSPFSGWRFRQPAAWAASLREYQLRDIHVPTWRKDDGATGFDLNDADGNLAEWDDRVDGHAASAARFTSFRTWANGAQGAFIAQSLTRAVDGSILSQTHNVAVVNLACTVTQVSTENVIGRVLVLNDDGKTATADSLSTIAREVNAALERALLQNRGEGPRASKAVWTPSSDDDLSVPDALLTGVLELVLNGTIHSVRTEVRVNG